MDAVSVTDVARALAEPGWSGLPRPRSRAAGRRRDREGSTSPRRARSASCRQARRHGADGRDRRSGQRPACCRTSAFTTGCEDRRCRSPTRRKITEGPRRALPGGRRRRAKAKMSGAGRRALAARAARSTSRTRRRWPRPRRSSSCSTTSSTRRSATARPTSTWSRSSTTSRSATASTVSLFELEAPPPHLAEALIARIKVMSDLDIAETRLPQDGRIELTVGGRSVDLRVSRRCRRCSASRR